MFAIAHVTITDLNLLPVSSLSEYVSLQMERLELERLLEDLRSEAGPETLAELACTYWNPRFNPRAGRVLTNNYIASRVASEESNSFYTSSNLAAARLQEDEEPSGRNQDSLYSQTSSSPLANTMSAVEEDQEDGGPRKKKVGDFSVCSWPCLDHTYTVR